jgi:beta-phosphoglucomutase-like phosphatase (HAD superfamily)
MKFAVLSHLGRSQLDAILDVTGLADYFPPDMRVTLEERYSDERSELLGGALRVEKLPERCVLFDNAPSAAVEAHEVLMKCVSFVDQYAKYELLAADWTIGEYWELDISSIRSLFSIRDDNVPLAVAEARGDLDRLPPRIKTGYQWDEGDR